MADIHHHTEKDSTDRLPLVYTVNDVMPLLKLSRNSVHKLLNTGALASVRCGRKYLIPVEAVTQYLSGPAGGRRE